VASKVAEPDTVADMEIFYWQINVGNGAHLFGQYC
jgi:hypothetical protein